MATDYRPITDLQPTLGQGGNAQAPVIVRDCRPYRLNRPKCVRKAEGPGKGGVCRYLLTSSKSVRSVKSVEWWNYKGLALTDLLPTLPTFARSLLGLVGAERPPTTPSCPLKKRAERRQSGPANCQLAGLRQQTPSAAIGSVRCAPIKTLKTTGNPAGKGYGTNNEQ